MILDCVIIDNQRIFVLRNSQQQPLIAGTFERMRDGISNKMCNVSESDRAAMLGRLEELRSTPLATLENCREATPGAATDQIKVKLLLNGIYTRML